MAVALGMTRGKNVTAERAAAKLMNSVPPEMRRASYFQKNGNLEKSNNNSDGGSSSAAAMGWDGHDATMGCGDGMISSDGTVVYGVWDDASRWDEFFGMNIFSLIYKINTSLDN
jgi:hypothetical protein